MGQGGCECKSVEHLRDTLFSDIIILILSPITSGNGALETFRDSLVAHNSLQAKAVLVRVEVFLVLLLHLSYESAKLLTIEAEK